MPEGDTIYRAARAMERAIGGKLCTGFETGLATADPRSGGMLITSVNGTAVHEHWMARALLDAGFVAAPWA